MSAPYDPLGRGLDPESYSLSPDGRIVESPTREDTGIHPDDLLFARRPKWGRPRKSSYNVYAYENPRTEYTRPSRPKRPQPSPEELAARARARAEEPIIDLAPGIEQGRYR